MGRGGRERYSDSLLVVVSEELTSGHLIIDVIHQSPKDITAANILLEIEHAELWEDGYRVTALKDFGLNGAKEIVLRQFPTEALSPQLEYPVDASTPEDYDIPF